MVIRRDAGLDYLKGVVLGVDKEAVTFEYSGNTIPAPLSRVAGVILARKKAEQPSPRLQMTTNDGGLLDVEVGRVQGSETCSRDDVQRSPSG